MVRNDWSWLGAGGRPRAAAWIAVIGLTLCVSPRAVMRAQEKGEAPRAAGAAVPAAQGARGSTAAGGDTHGAASQDGGSHDAGKGEPHDPHDLTHHNASSELAVPRELRFDHLVGSWAVFFLLLVIVGKLGWKPIMSGLQKREEAIAARIEEAERAADAARQRLREYEAKLAVAGDAARAILAQAQKDAEKTTGRMIADAEEAAQRERSRATAEIDAARSAALDDIATRSVDLAVLMANRIVRKNLTAADHKALISETLEQFHSRN
ncbi:MAG: F0F1 ATP synthase subunit B [Planctomycetes bacterium]|nr:F0F1 ATP synthase subunit B [Planctomycetota bacterium]